MRISEVSVRRPVFALMLIVGLVVLGLVSLEKLDVSLNPDVDFPLVTVTTLLRGASPETIEREVTDILEEQINTTEGIRTLGSVSAEGISRIHVEFDLSYDVSAKVQEVREKVSAARPLLPLEIDDPVVARIDLNAQPILSVMVGGSLSIRELSGFAEHVVSERLERLSGVGAVTAIGAREREIRIWLDPVKVAGYGIAVDEIARALRSENVELAGGRIQARDREWSVTTAGKVRRVEDFASLIMAERRGRLIYLRDVAVVEDGLEEETSIARLNGQPGVSLEVRRQSGANIVRVAHAVREEVERIRRDLPAGMKIVIARDTARFTERSISSFLDDMLLAGALVVIVILFFLRSFRSTMITALAIPTSVIASFTFFYMAGFTLNNMTLMALSLSIGLVIDDAIVVIEVIYRRLEGGEDRATAAERGASEVGLAVISTTLSVCAVFLPIAFMEGMVGQWFYEFGMVVVIAICVSTLVALTLTPMLASLSLRAGIEHGRLFQMLEGVHGAIDSVYARMLDWALRRQGVTVLMALLAILGGLYVASTLPFGFYRSTDRDEFTISFEMAVGTPLPVTDEVAHRVERIVAAHPHVRTLFSTVGSGRSHRPHTAGLYVGITPRGEREQSQSEVMMELRGQLIPALPEVEKLSVSHISWVSGSGSRSAAVTYTLRGPDLDRLAAYSDELLSRMRSDPVFVDVATSWETGKPEISLEIDRQRAADLGVPAVSVGRTIRALLAGEEVGSFEEGGRRYGVRIQVLPQFRDRPSELDLIRVRSLRGELIPLSNVATRRIGTGPVQIYRENRARQITVYANLVGDTPLGVATSRLEEWGRDLGIGPPDELVPSGSARAMRETGGALVFAFFLALAGIYMVLASLFNSLIHPLTIMISAPLSFLGGFLALKIGGLSLDMFSGIGLLVLMGLVMKNGILLVDYTNQLRDQGLSREEALRRSGRVRMRPVLMTTLALVFGLLPVAVGMSSGSDARQPMGAITVGGLITSTLLTLIVVPVMYGLMDDLSELPGRIGSRLKGLRRQAASRDDASSTPPAVR